MPEWLDTSRIDAGAIAAVAAVAVVAALALKAIGRLLALAVLAGVLAVATSLWAQRDDLAECHRTCECALYGQQVSMPDGAWCGTTTTVPADDGGDTPTTGPPDDADTAAG